MFLEQIVKSMKVVFVDAMGRVICAAKKFCRQIQQAFLKLLKEYKPIQYIPPKHRQMRYCWNKSRNWKRARGWQ